MLINKKYIKYNYSKRQSKIQYIVIHDTGNTNKGANAIAHYNFFNSADRQSSAHYFVDDQQCLEVVDPLLNRSWHCGDGKGRNGITNDNSIGVEMCVNIDGNYNKTYQNTIELVKHLMIKYNIKESNVVTHKDASGKICPYSLLKENKGGKNWSIFKSDISKNKEVLYRVVIGTYKDINNARKKAEEVGGFIIEYIKE